MFYDTFKRKDYVLSKECNKPLGEYAVEEGLDAPIFTTSFKSISSLSDAIKRCNSIQGCDRFTYNETTQDMKIISLGSDTVDDVKTNVYTRQVGITFK
jgi:hypothetical protein